MYEGGCAEGAVACELNEPPEDRSIDPMFRFSEDSNGSMMEERV